MDRNAMRDTKSRGRLRAHGSGGRALSARQWFGASINLLGMAAGLQWLALGHF